MSRWWLRYLQFTALLSGGLVMVIEVLGSRVIGPFFGVSLYVWTSLITVTLLALALGYAVGGWLADRGRSADQLYVHFDRGIAARIEDFAAVNVFDDRVEHVLNGLVMSFYLRNLQ